MNKRQAREDQAPKIQPSPMMTMIVQCNATPMPVDDDARRCSSNNSDGATCSVMGCIHPHTMQMVRCNAMAWMDETKEGALLKVLVTRSDPVKGSSVGYNGGDGSGSDTARAADGVRRREVLHEAQMVREAVAGDAAR